MARRLKSAPLWWWLIPALLLLAVQGTRSLDDDPLWIDELYSVGNIGAAYRVPFTPAQVWQSVRENSPQHTPGYFALLSGWASLVGWSPFALRALSLWFGLLAVVWTYRAGCEWLSPHAGLYAALVMSVGAFFIHFTHEIRMYTLIPALTALVLWLYLRIVQPMHRPAFWEWAGLFVGTLGLIYTHTIDVIPLAAIGLYHLLFVPKDRRWLLVAGVMALAGLLFLPWLPVLLEGVEFAAGENPALEPLRIFKVMLNLFSSGNPLELLALAVCAVIAVIAHRRHAGELWFLVIVMFLLTLAVNEVTEMLALNRNRYLIHLWPLLALLVGLGLTIIERRRWLVAFLLLTWVIVGIRSSLNPNFLITMDGPRQVAEFPPLEEMVEEVNDLAEPADFLVTFAHHPHVFERFKFVSIGEYYFHDLEVGSYRVTLPDPRPPQQIREDMRAAVGKRLTVWFVYEPEIDRQMLQLYRDVLAENYRLCAVALDEPELRIERYDYAPFACLDQPAGTPVLTFAEGVTLEAMRWQVDGDVLRVAAGWDVADTVPPNTYSVSLKLWPEDASDSFAVQSDYGLRPNGFGWQMAEIPTDDLPAGDYRLTVTVYDWRLGPRLLATDVNRLQGEELTVAQISLSNEREDG
jgi:hypothetical protein